MPEKRRDKVYDQRAPLLQPGVDIKRCGCRGSREGERKRLEDRVDEHEQELGPKLAIQCCFGGTGALLSCHGQRSSYLHLLEHRTRELAVRSNFLWQELQSLTNIFPTLPLVRAIFSPCFFWDTSFLTVCFTCYWAVGKCFFFFFLRERETEGGRERNFLTLWLIWWK